ncbi:hypothetical protein D9M68_699180 [compost metagenome]
MEKTISSMPDPSVASISRMVIESLPVAKVSTTSSLALNRRETVVSIDRRSVSTRRSPRLVELSSIVSWPSPFANR